MGEETGKWIINENSLKLGELERDYFSDFFFFFLSNKAHTFSAIEIIWGTF